MRGALLLLLLLIAGLASGCGQRGALYLRDSPPPRVKPAKPEAEKPVPYPQPVGDEPAAAKQP